MKTRSNLRWVISALILIGTGVPTTALAQDIKVGVILPLSGKLAKFGLIEKKSFQMALEEINAAGTVNGTKLNLSIKDTTGRPDVGRSVTEKLILEDKAIVIGGGYSSSVTWAAAGIAQRRKIPLLVNTASADKITEQGWPYVFRLNPPVSEHPRAVASFLREVARLKTAVIIHENTLSGEFGAKKLVEHCQEWGLKVIMKEGYELGASDLYPLLVTVKAKEPDLIYMISQPTDASVLIQQAKALNLTPKLFMGSATGFTSSEFKRQAGDAAEHVYAATIWNPSLPYPAVKRYYEKFIKTYQSPTDYHGAQAYAAMYVIADALRRAKALTPKGVRDSLAETDLVTAFGPVKFVSYEKKTQQNKLPTYLVQWINGQLETVWPREVASAEYVYPLPTD
jgi:branched-chain amino acid transport system substrate-binding protein